jgi:hypothetical protein
MTTGPGAAQFAHSLNRKDALDLPLGDAHNSFTNESNSSVSAAFASALGAGPDSIPVISSADGCISGSATRAPPHQTLDASLFSRDAEDQHEAPATWSAWLSEERRITDMLDMTGPRPFFPPSSTGGRGSAAFFSRAMQTPRFFDPSVSDIDGLASRVPQGFLGSMMDSDTSDTGSRSTASRRARLGTEGSATTIPGMDLFRHEESQNLSRCEHMRVLASAASETWRSAVHHSLWTSAALPESRAAQSTKLLAITLRLHHARSSRVRT